MERPQAIIQAFNRYIVLGAIGLTLSLLVIFRFIPLRLRATFIPGGFLGGVIGYTLWMHLLGPDLLP